MFFNKKQSIVDIQKVINYLPDIFYSNINLIQVSISNHKEFSDKDSNLRYAINLGYYILCCAITF